MENFSEYTDEKVESKQQASANPMQDVQVANYLVEAIGDSKRVGEMLYKAYKVLTRLYPHEDDPENRWTERRLKSWWNGESATVRHFQMVELYEAAEKVKHEREILKRAREEHAEFIEKTKRLRALAELAKAHRTGAGL